MSARVEEKVCRHGHVGQYKSRGDGYKYCAACHSARGRRAWARGRERARALADGFCECGQIKSRVRDVACERCALRDQLQLDGAHRPNMLYSELIGYASETAHEIASRLGKDVEAVRQGLSRMVAQGLLTARTDPMWDGSSNDSIRYTLKHTGDMVPKMHGKSSSVQS